MTTTATSFGVTTALASQLDGQVLRPGDDGYDASRRVWNAMVDRRPEVIVRAANAADVTTAVRFARERDLAIGVRCGGHSIVGLAVPDGGLMIDLTAMSAVHVDPRRRRARVQGGALLGALDHASQRHGLATTAGNVSHTGVGGLTLGGGMGWLARRHGLTCDNVAAYTVVTADGELVRASATERPELFWGLRGGGGNFGIVTEFEFRLHEEPGHSLTVDLVMPTEAALPALRGWRDLSAEAPRAATLTASVSGGRATVGYVWVGDPRAGHALLPQLRTAIGAASQAATEQVREMSYLQLQTIDDSVGGHAYRRYWKGHYFDQLSDTALQAFLLRGSADGRGELLPSVSLQAHGGAIADVPDEDSAFSHRQAAFEYVASARWTDPAEDAARMAVARDCGRALDGFATGAYVNTLGDEGASGVRRAYSPVQLARLTALKDVFDPDNVFHLNQNIRPSRG
jgi:FAD/FMN-containing dehydrogenase